MTKVTGYDKTIALGCLDRGMWEHPKHTRALIESHAELWERVKSQSTENNVLKEALASAIQMAREHHLTEATVYFQEVCERIQADQESPDG